MNITEDSESSSQKSGNGPTQIKIKKMFGET